MTAQASGRPKPSPTSPLALSILLLNTAALLYLLVSTTRSLAHITSLLSLRQLIPGRSPIDIHEPNVALAAPSELLGAPGGGIVAPSQDDDLEPSSRPVHETDAAESTSHPQNGLAESERLFQQNLRKRLQFYGKNPWRKLEAMAARSRKASTISSAFVLEMYGPNYPCFPEERIGRWSDGGKWVCRPAALNSSSVVYSIGSNGVDTFETELHQRAGCEIHVFDHTVSKAVQAVVSRKEEYRFHNLGLAVTSDPGARLSSLQDMMSRLGHERVDVFKVDCEGCEYDVMPSILGASAGRPPFGQVQIEVHRIKDRKKLGRFLDMMESHGYRLFHLEMNWRAMDCFELAYIHESLCRPSI